MNPFYLFIAFIFVVWGTFVWLARDVVRGVFRAAADNVKNYAPAYAKGGALILLASLQAFVETFEKLSSDVASVLPWWSWLAMFCGPVTAALATYIAFVDRTMERIRDDKEERESNPPFTLPKP